VPDLRVALFLLPPVFAPPFVLPSPFAGPSSLPVVIASPARSVASLMLNDLPASILSHLN
jgi:hypothetical protein